MHIYIVKAHYSDGTSEDLCTLGSFSALLRWIKEEFEVDLPFSYNSNAQSGYFTSKVKVDGELVTLSYEQHDVVE